MMKINGDRNSPKDLREAVVDPRPFHFKCAASPSSM